MSGQLFMSKETADNHEEDTRLDPEQASWALPGLRRDSVGPASSLPTGGQAASGSKAEEVRSHMY